MMNDPFRLPSYFYASVVPPAVSTPPALTNDTVMTVPRRTRVPAILVELAYLTNEADARRLRDDPYGFAQGIYSGMLAYFGFDPV